MKLPKCFEKIIRLIKMIEEKDFFRTVDIKN